MIIDATKPVNKKEETHQNQVSNVEEQTQGEGKLENLPDQNEKYAQAVSNKGNSSSPEQNQKAFADPEIQTEI